jgi:hypothetical protein
MLSHPLGRESAWHFFHCRRLQRVIHPRINARVHAM